MQTMFVSFYADAGIIQEDFAVITGVSDEILIYENNRSAFEHIETILTN